MALVSQSILPAIAAARTQQITVTYDSIKVYANGKLMEKDGAGNPIQEPFMLGGVTMVPARVLGEAAFGGVTSWDETTKTLYLGPATGSGTPPAGNQNERGNTAGNINNGGIAAIKGDRIYYRNDANGGRLYSMRTDGSDWKEME